MTTKKPYASQFQFLAVAVYKLFYQHTIARKMFDDLRLFQNSDTFEKLLKSENGKDIATNFLSLMEQFEKLSKEDKLKFDGKFGHLFNTKINTLEKSFDTIDRDGDKEEDEVITQLQFQSVLIFIILISFGKFYIFC